MPCSPSQIVPRSRAVAARERIRTRLVALLSRLDGAGAAHHVVTERSDDALATRLMDAFRVTRDPDVFEGLIEWVRPQFSGRVRARLRRLVAKLDAGTQAYFALVDGTVKFSKRGKERRTFVAVEPLSDAAE